MRSRPKNTVNIVIVRKEMHFGQHKFCDTVHAQVRTIIVRGSEATYQNHITFSKVCRSQVYLPQTQLFLYTLLRC